MAAAPPFPGDPDSDPPEPPLRPDVNTLSALAEAQRIDLDTIIDPVWRAGLHEIAAGNHMTHGRHRPDLLGISQIAGAGRCLCTGLHGDQCVLWADAEDLRCTACRIACSP